MRHTLEAAINKFEKQGPYTFVNAFALAKRCARSNEWQLGDSLDIISHKFPLPEFKLLVNAKSHLNANDFAIWAKGTDDWDIQCINHQHTNEQLALIAERVDILDGIVADVDWSKMPQRITIDVLVGLRNQNIRDTSPERK